MTMTIEDVILTADRRGVSRLRHFLPKDFCSRAAWALHGAPQRVLIASGFHVERPAAGGHPASEERHAAFRSETDGPPGALAIARAVRELGGQAVLVSDGHAASVLSDVDGTDLVGLEDFLAHPQAPAVIDFPRAERETSDKLALRLLDVFQPTALVAVERCGATEDGTYRNMRGQDITDITARLDLLFSRGVTIGVGDGGNEIGMGSLALHCVEHGITKWPCQTPVLFPVIASVSNWGAYGICAGLSLLAGRNLLPGEDEVSTIIERMVLLESIDGVTLQWATTVDGHPPEVNVDVLRKLQSLVGAGLTA